MPPFILERILTIKTNYLQLLDFYLSLKAWLEQIRSGLESFTKFKFKKRNTKDVSILKNNFCTILDCRFQIFLPF